MHKNIRNFVLRIPVNYYLITIIGHFDGECDRYCVWIISNLVLLRVRRFASLRWYLPLILQDGVQVERGTLMLRIPRGSFTDAHQLWKLWANHFQSHPVIPYASKSAFVEGKYAPLNRTHAIRPIDFQFSTERAYSQPGTVSNHFNSGICSSLCKWGRSRGLVFPYKRERPFKFRGQIHGTADEVRLPQLLWNWRQLVRCAQSGRQGLYQGTSDCPWEAPERSAAAVPARALRSKWHLQGSVIYIDLYKIESTLWNLFLQLHFLRISRD